MLEIKKVEVRYGQAIAVAGVTLHVGEGAWVALIGANGAGKTSLLRSIVGLEPQRGEISFGGEEISRLRAMPEALDRTGSKKVDVNQALPQHVISAEGPYAAMRLDLSDTHPLRSNNVMAEDIYACEAVQCGMESGSCEIGPLPRWESTLTFFQRHILDYMWT